MTVYRLDLDNEQITELDKTTFTAENVLERQLQKILMLQPDVISPGTRIVAADHCPWENSKHRIDLLGIDKGGNLVVIELKRDNSLKMELQAIRYAAMISVLRFEELVDIYREFLAKYGSKLGKHGGEPEDAEQILLEHLNKDDSDEEQFDTKEEFNSDAKKLKIILASADFSTELTTSVLWLRDQFGVDIECIQMCPYINDGQTLLDVQTIIPLPETAEYQTRIREKKDEEREAAKGRYIYNVSIGGNPYRTLGKGRMIFRIISGVLKSGITPQDVMEAISRKGLFEELDGELSAEEASNRINQKPSRDLRPLEKRFFCDDGEVFHFDGKTYVLTNQWGVGRQDAASAASQLKKAFPDLKIEFERCE